METLRKLPHFFGSIFLGPKHIWSSFSYHFPNSEARGITISALSAWWLPSCKTATTRTAPTTSTAVPSTATTRDGFSSHSECGTSISNRPCWNWRCCDRDVETTRNATIRKDIYHSCTRRNSQVLHPVQLLIAPESLYSPIIRNCSCL